MQPEGPPPRVDAQSDGQAGLKRQRRHAPTFACLVAFVDMAGVGIAVPVTPSLIQSVAPVTVQEAARIGGYFLFLYAAIQFLVSPLMGCLSDRFGRKPALLLACFGLSLDYVLMAVAPSLVLLFLGRILAGLCGATLGPARAVIADIAAPEERSKGFGLLSAAGGLGFVFGPVVGGLLGQLDTRAPFWAAALLIFGVTLYGLFCFKETLAPERRSPIRLTDANPLSSLMRLRVFPEVHGLLLSFFLLQLAAYSLYSIWPYYGIEKFGWSPLVTGLTLTLYGIIFAILQAGFTARVTSRFSNRSIVVFSLAIGIFVYAGYAFAGSTAVMIVILVASSATAFNNPCFHALISGSVPDDSQGMLQGVVSSVVSMAAILGPILMTTLFAATSDEAGVYFPGAPFLLSSCIIAICLLVFLQASGRRKPMV